MYKDRLLTLADFLEKEVPPDRFDMREWKLGECGCAVGWGATIPEFQRLGLRLETRGSRKKYAPVFGEYEAMDAVGAFFGITERDACYLFLAPSYYEKLLWAIPKPHDVAERIRGFVGALTRP